MSTTNPTLMPTNNPTTYPTSAPTNQPTSNPTVSPTTYPTSTPTNQPTSDPTVSPTSYPTALPTRAPTDVPTVSPTILPTRTPTQNPTSMFSTENASIKSTDKMSRWFTMEPIIAFSSALLVLVAVIFICVVKVKKTNQKRDENVISNALIALIVIGEYDYCITDEDDVDGEQVLYSLPLEKDVVHLTALFSLLNYNIISRNDAIKLHWKADEVVSFLQNDVGKELFDDNGELNYDGLIEVISSHGMKDNIITSDRKTIEKVALHRIVSIKYPNSREIPRLFLFDSCEGSEQRIKDEYKMDILEEKEQSKGFGLNDVQGGFKWTTSTKNPDYKLVEIHAANAGFQAKAHMQFGSYLIYLFTKKMKS
eukprot:1083377_1